MNETKDDAPNFLDSSFIERDDGREELSAVLKTWPACTYAFEASYRSPADESVLDRAKGLNDRSLVESK